MISPAHPSRSVPSAGEDGASLRGGGTRARRARQYRRHARHLDVLLRHHRQPLAGGDRHQHGRRGTGAGAVDPRQDRGAAASGARRLGRRGQAICAPRSMRACHGAGPPRCVAEVRRSGAGGALRADGERCLRRRAHQPRPKAAASPLVGAGPGDPELLTLKALRALQSADIILYDRLVSPEILELARREAKRMLVGKAGNGPRCRQDDINALMVKLARSGQRVVRLKGGDPMVFGRAAEEIEICRAAGIPVEVVPGITAALGRRRRAANPAHRSAPRAPPAVHHRPHRGRRPARRQLGERGRPVDDHRVLHGRRHLRAHAARAARRRPAPATPALAVSSATTPRSTHVRCPVRDLPAALDRPRPVGALPDHARQRARRRRGAGSARRRASVGWVSAAARNPTRLAPGIVGLRAAP